MLPFNPLCRHCKKFICVKFCKIVAVYVCLSEFAFMALHVFAVLVRNMPSFLSILTWLAWYSVFCFLRSKLFFLSQNHNCFIFRSQIESSRMEWVSIFDGGVCVWHMAGMFRLYLMSLWKWIKEHYYEAGNSLGVSCLAVNVQGNVPEKKRLGPPNDFFITKICSLSLSHTHTQCKENSFGLQQHWHKFCSLSLSLYISSTS